MHKTRTAKKIQYKCKLSLDLKQKKVLIVKQKSTKKMTAAEPKDNSNEKFTIDDDLFNEYLEDRANGQNTRSSSVKSKREENPVDELEYVMND